MKQHWDFKDSAKSIVQWEHLHRILQDIFLNYYLSLQRDLTLTGLGLNTICRPSSMLKMCSYKEWPCILHISKPLGKLRLPPLFNATWPQQNLQVLENTHARAK